MARFDVDAVLSLVDLNSCDRDREGLKGPVKTLRCRGVDIGVRVDGGWVREAIDFCANADVRGRSREHLDGWGNIVSHEDLKVTRTWTNTLLY
jgi:hypothetical protein